MPDKAKSENHKPNLDMIDDDHEELHGFLAEVSENIYAVSNPTSQLIWSLEQLVENLSAHFRREETLMEAVNYRALEKHCRQHETLERGFKEILRELKAGDCIDSTKALYRIYEDRLGKHTAQSDGLLPLHGDTSSSHSA